MTEAGAEVVGAGVACGEELLRLHRPELLVITSTSLDGTDRRLDPVRRSTGRLPPCGSLLPGAGSRPRSSLFPVSRSRRLSRLRRRN